MKISLRYNKNCFFIELLNMDLAYFKVDNKIEDPDIIINIGKFKPSNDGCFLVDNRCYIKHNYLYCKDIDGMVQWDVEIFGFEEGITTINFDYNILNRNSFIPCLPIQNFLIEGLLFYKLFRKGYFLIHSAGVCKNNFGILMAGRGGAFKTSLSMDFIRKKEYQFFGDDMVILNKNRILPFPISLVRFGFMLKNLPTENFRNRLDKIKMIKSIINNYNHLDNTYIAENSQINILLSITKRNELMELEVKKEPNKKIIIKKLIYSNQLEMSLHGSHMPKLTGMTSNHFYRYLLSYNYIFPKSKLANYFYELEDELLETFKDVPIYEVDIPEKYNANIFDELCKILNL